jgi:ABC-type glycerol-3-phosphate transport system substrate-binding protein
MTMSRFKRSGILAVAMAVAGASTLAACSSSDKAQLSVWHEMTGSGNTAMQQVISDFNSTSKDASISARQIADSQVDTVERTGMSGPNPPDILQYEGYRHTADYAKAGQLTDLTSWWNKHKSAFTQPDSQIVKDACTYQGKVYCIPWNFYTNNQLYYNPDLLKKYHLSLPKSLADLDAIAAKLKGTGVTPVSLYAQEGWEAAHWYYLLSTQRCTVKTVKSAIDKTGAKWTDPCFLKAAEDLSGLAKQGVFPKGVSGSDYNAMMSLFLSGKALFMETGTWFQTTIQESPPSFKVGVAPFPQADPAHPSDQLVGGINEVFGVPAKGHHKKQAMEFLDTLATKKSGEAFAKGGVMSFVAGADDALPADLKNTWKQDEKALEGGDNIVTYYENLLPPQMGLDTVYNESAALAAGQTTPQKFVQSLQAASDAGK